jgi:hypothetical protein
MSHKFNKASNDYLEFWDFEIPTSEVRRVWHATLHWWLRQR